MEIVLTFLVDVTSLTSVDLQLYAVAAADTIEHEPSAKQCTEVLQIIKPNSLVSGAKPKYW